MKVQALQVKTGQEYWSLVEKTARRVESWPEWKTAGWATTQRPEKNESSSSEPESGQDPKPPGV